MKYTREVLQVQATPAPEINDSARCQWGAIHDALLDWAPGSVQIPCIPPDLGDIRPQLSATRQSNPRRPISKQDANLALDRTAESESETDRPFDSRRCTLGLRLVAVYLFSALLCLNFIMCELRSKQWPLFNRLCYESAHVRDLESASAKEGLRVSVLISE